MLAKPEYSSPPDEVCCWPGRYREETCWQKRTKTPILCSKCLKTGVPKAKSAQKPRFCARNARKWGFRRQKAHKNLDFVLEMPENGGFEGKKRTKMPILCSGGARSRELFREESGAGWPPRGTRRRGGAAEMVAPRRKRALLLGLDL